MNPIDLGRCPVYGSFFGIMGASMATCLCCLGAGYGIAKSSIAISTASIYKPDGIVRNLMPPIMAGIVAIYGLIVSVMIINSVKERSALHTNFLQLGAGLTVGVCGLSAGMSIGIVGDAGVRAASQQPRMFMGMIMILIFAEVLGMYGTIIAIMLLTSGSDVTNCS